MLRQDLETAGIPYRDSAGRVLDFHALRHSNINLTMSRYTHIFSGQESDAINRLPDLSVPSKQQKAIATGTDGKAFETAPNDAEKLTPKLTPTAYCQCHRPATDGNLLSGKTNKASAYNPLPSSTLSTKKKALSAHDTNKAQTRPTGFEPATIGSTVRYSNLISLPSTTTYVSQKMCLTHLLTQKVQKLPKTSPLAR